MTAMPVYISQPLYERLREEAVQAKLSPDELAETLLSQELEPPHPHVTIEVSRFGRRPVIKGTRVGVASIVAYQRLGFTPEKIVADLLPHLSLAQVYDALSFYFEHQEAVDRELDSDTEKEWMKRLREMAGSDEAFIRMTGGRIPLNG